MLALHAAALRCGAQPAPESSKDDRTNLPTAPDATAGNPLVLGLFCAHRRSLGTVPESVQASIESLVERLQAAHASESDIAPPRLWAAVQQMALELLMADGPREMASDERLQGIEASVVHEWLHRLGLCRPRSETAGSHRVAFVHRRLLEYFAACHVLDHDPGIPPERYLEDHRLRDVTIALLRAGPAKRAGPVIERAGVLLDRALDALPETWMGLRSQAPGSARELERSRREAPTDEFPWREPAGASLPSRRSRSSVETPVEPLAD